MKRAGRKSCSLSVRPPTAQYTYKPSSCLNRRPLPARWYSTAHCGKPDSGGGISLEYRPWWFAVCRWSQGTGAFPARYRWWHKAAGCSRQGGKNDFLNICKIRSVWFPFSPTFSAKSQAFLYKKRTTYDCGNKTAKENGKGEKHYEEQQSDQCSPGSWGYGQVQDAGCPGRWWSSYLLNYNRIIQNNSNQRLVSKSIVVHSIKNFISSSFSRYIHKRSGESFGSLSMEQQKRYLEKYRLPERFFRSRDGIESVPYKPQNRER